MVRGEERADGFFVRNKSALYMGLAALVIAGTADLVAGFFMVSMEDYILMVPGMMVLIYAAIGMRGNIFGAMGSRLGTAMHIGTFQLSFRKKSVLRSNVEAAMVDGRMVMEDGVLVTLDEEKIIFEVQARAKKLAQDLDLKYTHWGKAIPPWW